MPKLFNFLKKLISDNPWLFLKSRAIMFYHLVAGTWKTVIPPRDFRAKELKKNTIDPKFEMSNEGHFFDIEVPFPKLEEFGMWLQWHPYTRSLYTIIPSILISLIVLFSWRLTPACSIASIIILCRLPVFFFLCGFAQFKYLFDVYLFGFLILPFFYWEIKNKKQNSDARNSTREQTEDISG